MLKKFKNPLPPPWDVYEAGQGVWNFGEAAGGSAMSSHYSVADGIFQGNTRELDIVYCTC